MTAEVANRRPRIGVIAGANLGALMLALCMAANQNHGAEGPIADGIRGSIVKRHPAARLMPQWVRAFGSMHRTPRRARWPATGATQ